MIRWSVNFLRCSFIAFIGISYPVYSLAATELLPDEYKQKIDIAVMRNAVDRSALLATMTWVSQLDRSAESSIIIAELARLEYAYAEVETERSTRIELYKKCINTADRALALNGNEIGALYWKAAAMGKLSEESGMLRALRLTRQVEKLFLHVITLDERYDSAGAHKALGRMYHKLPGFPISFGNKDKALFHLNRAHTFFPDDIITRAFYAEVLFDMGKKQEARKHAKFILGFPVAVENNFRYSPFIEIARNISKKTGA